MGDQWIFGELGQEHKEFAGMKSAHLGEMRKAGIRVPPGFALSLKSYEKFMRETGAVEEIHRYLSTFTADPNKHDHLMRYQEASEVIRSIVESKRMPEDLETAIKRHYVDLCQKTGVPNVLVATRSSGPASHPGQYETYLYISGVSEVFKNIIKVWSSTFNQRSLIARARKGLPLEFDPIGVCVLKMVNAKAAGVMFTLNPVNGDHAKIAVGGNWGLGEAVVSGEVTNDQWLIDKVTLEILNRTIASKTKEYIFDPEQKVVLYKEIGAERRTNPCLNNEELSELARQAKRIEKHFGVPQDIEWALDKDLPFPQNVLFVQARPETIWSKKQAKSVLETKKQFGEYDIFPLVRKE
jgi:pyruvate,water dikinase